MSPRPDFRIVDWVLVACWLPSHIHGGCNGIDFDVIEISQGLMMCLMSARVRFAVGNARTS